MTDIPKMIFSAAKALFSERYLQFAANNTFSPVMYSTDEGKMCFGLVSESAVLIIARAHRTVPLLTLINSGDDGNIWGYIT